MDVRFVRSLTAISPSIVRRESFGMQSTSNRLRLRTPSDHSAPPKGMPTLSHHATLTKEQELHWLALKMTAGLGTRTAYQLIQKLRTPEAIFRSSPSELEAHGLARGIAASRFQAAALLRTLRTSRTSWQNSGRSSFQSRRRSTRSDCVKSMIHP